MPVLAFELHHVHGALSAFAEREKADARRRHSTWKNY
jgi:hypothetical protein